MAYLPVTVGLKRDRWSSWLKRELEAGEEEKSLKSNAMRDQRSS
jgi:hypothetical protein